MLTLTHLHQLFSIETCQTYLHALRWKDRPLQCPRCYSHDVDPWGNFHYRPGCNRSWCNGCKRTFNDLTNTCCTRASGRCHTGFWPPFSSVSPARLGALPGRWVSMSAPALGGAGGCGMPPYPMRCSANWRARLKPMNCITRLATKAKHHKAGRKRWGAARVVAVRSASPVEAMMGLYKDACKSGHRTRMGGLPPIIRAVFGGIILSMARLIHAVGHDPIG
jgi:hypothetical protein